jgi:hypothetical protein
MALSFHPKRDLGAPTGLQPSTSMIMIQIIASGYQTFGQTFDINEAEKTVEIKLNAPQKQYSAHEP